MFGNTPEGYDDLSFDPVEAHIREMIEWGNQLKDGGKFSRMRPEDQRAQAIRWIEGEKGTNLFNLLESGLRGTDSYNFEANGKVYTVRPDPKSEGWFPKPLEVSTGNSTFVLKAGGQIAFNEVKDLQEHDPEAYSQLVEDLTALLEGGQKKDEATGGANDSQETDPIFKLGKLLEAENMNKHEAEKLERRTQAMERRTKATRDLLSNILG